MPHKQPSVPIVCDARVECDDQVWVRQMLTVLEVFSLSHGRQMLVVRGAEETDGVLARLDRLAGGSGCRLVLLLLLLALFWIYVVVIA